MFSCGHVVNDKKQMDNHHRNGCNIDLEIKSRGTIKIKSEAKTKTKSKTKSKIKSKIKTKTKIKTKSKQETKTKSKHKIKTNRNLSSTKKIHDIRELHLSSQVPKYYHEIGIKQIELFNSLAIKFKKSFVVSGCKLSKRHVHMIRVLEVVNNKDDSLEQYIKCCLSNSEFLVTQDDVPKIFYIPLDKIQYIYKQDSKNEYYLLILKNNFTYRCYYPTINGNILKFESDNNKLININFNKIRAIVGINDASKDVKYFPLYR